MENIEKVAVVVDDHALFTDSFTLLLEKVGIFDEIHVLNDAKMRMDYFLKNPRKEVYLFLDYYLGDQLGIEIVNEIRRINRKVKIIIISSVTQIVAIRTIISARPEAVISKIASFDVVIDCLNRLKKGTSFFCPIIANILEEASKVQEVLLSSREIEILEFFAKGYSVNATAEKFCLSRHTVVAHRRKMMKKTNTNSITELLSYVRKSGLILD
ncbi:response regulator transcription factor [Flavobacterium sp. CBA20B-1]|uniref:helix-turn-helix transcriptional regulator n=1 Tax=unclassified Flavobacterium TaxID=196869 RepID=UPI0022251995|nr:MULTISPECIES: response regulator transcription factor [unclassified Flavobacterium]WCM41305.1 response regulator transcription factor [Flavobacterium sp. CBA20B-1]